MELEEQQLGGFYAISRYYDKAVFEGERRRQKVEWRGPA